MGVMGDTQAKLVFPGQLIGAKHSQGITYCTLGNQRRGAGQGGTVWASFPLPSAQVVSELSMYCLPVPNTPFFACSVIMLMGPLSIFPAASTVGSFISREHWKRKSFSP